MPAPGGSATCPSRCYRCIGFGLSFYRLPAGGSPAVCLIWFCPTFCSLRFSSMEATNLLCSAAFCRGWATITGDLFAVVHLSTAWAAAPCLPCIS